MRNMKYYILALCLLVAAGCTTVTVNIDPVKSWEGHYLTTNDFYKATSDISLEKGESIWVLSDRTLNRVLKNIKK